MSGKWLELLKEIAPSVTRAAVLRDPRLPPGSASSARIQSAAPSFGVEVSPIDVGDAAKSSAASRPSRAGSNGGLIVTGERVVGSSSRADRLACGPTQSCPRSTSNRFFVTGGGLISYGPIGRSIPARRRLCRSHPEGREAGRPSGAGADQVRAGHQPQDRQGARPRSAADAARPRRRGDRMRAARVHHAARRRGAAWPLAARAQQRERMRRIGVLMARPRTIRMGRPARARSCRGCSNSGWTDGRNVRIDIPLGRGRCRRHSQIRGRIGRARAGRHPALLAARPLGPLLQATRTVPIVFTHRPRSGRRRLRRQPGAAGRQRHRLHRLRIRHQRRNGWNC